MTCDVVVIPPGGREGEGEGGGRGEGVEREGGREGEGEGREGREGGRCTYTGRLPW